MYKKEACQIARNVFWGRGSTTVQNSILQLFCCLSTKFFNALFFFFYQYFEINRHSE